jgi:hypothetical protein
MTDSKTDSIYSIAIWDAKIAGQVTIAPPPSPLLRTFLDVDGFDADDLTTDDKHWYVPCTAKDGTSIRPSLLPQRISIVAAYVDNTGTIVTPPASTNATINLANVSAFRGIAMNASFPGRSDSAPDFEPVAITASFGADHTARFPVNCWDYGGFATAVVTHNSQTSPPLPVPVDNENGNRIADAGWLAGTVHIDDTGLGAGVDEDNDPVVSGPPVDLGLFGDGFVTFEEYRGFVVWNGEHRRTNPFKKDLFLSSDLETGIAFAYPNLPTATHRVTGENETEIPQYRTADRVMNFNWQNDGYGGDIPGRGRE